MKQLIINVAYCIYRITGELLAFTLASLVIVLMVLSLPCKLMGGLYVSFRIYRDYLGTFMDLERKYAS